MSQSAAPNAGFRVRLQTLVEDRRTRWAITALICINAVTLGLETSERAMAAAGGLLVALDRAILSVFVIEVSAKIVAYGRRFPRDPWNVFDFLVVAIGLVPATESFSVLRALRVLRVLRLISIVPSMRRVVQALLSAIPGMGSILLLLVLIFYVAGVMATKLFGATHPQWFGTIGGSMYTLFQIMTLESWSMAIVRPVMEIHDWAWAFFVPFIAMTSFAVLNLFIAIIVNAMETHHRLEMAEEEAQREAERTARNQRLDEELGALRGEMTALRQAVERLDRRADEGGPGGG
jgi:voltage-gated sodium channel